MRLTATFLTAFLWRENLLPREDPSMYLGGRSGSPTPAISRS